MGFNAFYIPYKTFGLFIGRRAEPKPADLSIKLRKLQQGQLTLLLKTVNQSVNQSVNQHIL